MSNILNHNRFPFKCRILRDEYWDFFLSADGFGSLTSYENTSDIVDRCLISYIDLNDGDCVWFDTLYSKKDYKWENTVNNGLKLENIGFTGMDNGLITFKKDTTSNKDFIDLFTNSVYEVPEDTRLILNKVDGSNEIYDYPNCIMSDDNGVISAKLSGGFFQGFFKSGCDYILLPTNIGSGLSFEFTLKKSDIVEEGTYTLNDRYPENKGIFFYIGTRAENKWWKKYKVDEAFDDISHEYFGDDYVSDGYLTIAGYSNDYIINDAPSFLVSDYFSEKYVDEEYYDIFCEEKCDKDDCSCNNTDNSKDDSCKVVFTYPEFLNTYQSNAIWKTTCGGVWVENENWTLEENYRCCCNSSCCSCHKKKDKKKKQKCNTCDYFSDDYFKKEKLDCQTCYPGYMDTSYFAKDVELDPNENLKTKDQVELKQANVYDITTDNKFLLFDRTCDGFTVDNWIEGSTVTIRDVKASPKENYFLLFDRTCNGLTIDSNLDTLINNTYNVKNDLYRNAFALQIKDDGSVGYKYMVKDCDSEDGYEILSEFSFENVIPENEWVTIHVRIEPLGKIYNGTEISMPETQKMRMLFYVNGKLVMVTKELPTFNFRELNDTPDKQEGVPFNISLGGGTQGLCDVIYYDNRKTPDKVLPLEKEFGGSFIGYFKSFKMYDCNINFTEIRQNYAYEKVNMSENKLFI